MRRWRCVRASYLKVYATFNPSAWSGLSYTAFLGNFQVLPTNYVLLIYNYESFKRLGKLKLT